MKNYKVTVAEPEFQISELINEFGEVEVIKAVDEVIAQRKIDMEDHLRGDVDYDLHQTPEPEGYESVKDYEESTGLKVDPNEEREN